MKGYERNSCNQIRETDRQMDGGTDIKHGNWNIQMYNFYTIFHFSTEVFCDLMSCVFFMGTNSISDNITASICRAANG